MARISLTRNIKFRRLVKRLGIPEPHVRGHLEYLWETAHEGVNPVIGSWEHVELAAEWAGEVGVFAAACEEAGFIERDEDNQLVIHDFWENCPDYVRLRAKRKQERRESLYNRERPTTSEKVRLHDGKTPTSRPAPPRPRERDTSTNVGVSNNSPATPTADRSPEDPGPGIAGPPRRHTNPPGEIDRLVDYQTEVLNKLDGITDGRERKDRGTLLAIAKHVPPSVVHAALEATQDARLRALDGEHARVSHARYFTDGVKRRCTSANIASPFSVETTPKNVSQTSQNRPGATIGGR